MFDFGTFAREYRIPTIGAGRGEKHHVREGWIGFYCPLCRGPHIAFSTQYGFCSCWRCGTLRLLDVIRWLTHCDKEKAWEIRQKFDDKKKLKTPTRKAGSDARPKSAPVPLGLAPLSSQHLDYLRGRGIVQARLVAREWGLQGTRHLSGPWSWRVVAPIYNEDEEIVAYVGRSIGDAKPKYRVTEASKCVEPPEGLLYGIHKVKGDTIAVVEGPGDVWKMGPGFVATMSMDWREEQADKLRRFKRRFVIYDPEEAATKKAMALAEWLSMFPGETEVISDIPSDPGGLSDKYARKLRQMIFGRAD